MNITPGTWSVSNGVLIRVTATLPNDTKHPVVVAGVHRVGKFNGRIGVGDPFSNACLIAAAPRMYQALETTERLINEALPRFDWAKSPLDATAIHLLNVVPGIVKRAMMQARGEI